MTRAELSSQLNPAMAARVGRPRTVLDLGCGSGVNGLVAKRVGARVTGLEADPELCNRARRLLDEVLAVASRDLEQVAAALAERRFDLVLIPYWLEHVEDPGALVALASRHLTSEGRLVYAVRNESAWTRRLGLQDAALGFPAAPAHDARFYEARVAEEWARVAGLERLELGLNPLLLKALRGVLDPDFYASARHDEAAPTGFRDWSVYELYSQTVLPLEAKAAGLAPALLSYQHVVVARKPPSPGPLTLTVGMLSMDEEPSMARMMDAVRRQAPDARILVVDSSMKDETPVIAERLGARVLRQLPPRGHGPAMELLMYEAAAQSDALIYLDCDFTYPPENIPHIRRILESGVDVVNAARTRTRPQAMPLANFAANRAFVLCSRALNGVQVADLHSGMRGYRSSVIRNFSFDGSGDALPIDTLLWPARSGYRVVEIPIEYQERVGASKLRKLAGTAWTFIRLAKGLKVGSREAAHYEVWPDSGGSGS